ncbi:MAG: bifunctional DNA-formamidopyrimidine glycosylase/DNA-(apurinic or apyrimidinic site) lyase [Vicinamibacterales bacterium]
MPELPEVEATRCALQSVMEGARFQSVVARRPDLRLPLPPHFASRLEGQRVNSLGRRGKYLVAELSSGDVLLMHLGMSGSFGVTIDGGEQVLGDFYRARGTAFRHDHIVFEMSSGATITFNDPRRFGFVDLVASHALPSHPALSALGPEPLARDFDAAVLARACRGKKTSLKAALVDQRVVAGLGNIYVCEALHRARLSPRRRASTIATARGLPRDEAHRLTAAIKRVLRDAITRGTARAGVADDADTESSDFRHRFRVYDREGACCVTRGCRGIVKRIVQGRRSTFFCPVCQK